MWSRKNLAASLATAAVVAGCLALANPTRLEAAPEGSEPSAETLYTAQCASCHGSEMNGGQFGPTLKGAAFAAKWNGRHADLLALVETTMPPPDGRALSPAEYGRVVNLIVAANGGMEPERPTAQRSSAAPSPGKAPLSEDLAPGYGPRASATPIFEDAHYAKVMAERQKMLARISPVTAAMLASPPAGDWLHWRRTQDSNGFSPLDQIDRTNVSRLGLKWAWSPKTGKNEIAPIVHDGVMFINSDNDVEALDAATGSLLWRYTRPTPPEYRGPLNNVHRSIAIYERMLLVPTADRHLVALDITSGKVVWDTQIVPPAVPVPVLSAGPLVAGDVLVQGVSLGASCPGGCYVVGLDARTGRKLWRFDTVAKPGSPGGESWNGTPPEERSGGAVWTTGSYDPKLDLVYFGTAGTYDISRLLRTAPGAPEGSGDGLYTNSTIALRPRTGELVWYHQHFPQEVWDLDEAFERTLVTLPVDGRERDLVISSGKAGILDVLDRRNGDYVFSIDLGLNNLVTAIDPRTGRRTVDPAKIPGPNETVDVCPSLQGARNWLASAYNPLRRIIYMPLQKLCMDLIWVEPEGGTDSKVDIAWMLKQMPGTDGMYGVLQAIDLETRETVWTHRTRAVAASSLLATAGGLVFAGNSDRWFGALDDRTGEVLWETRLNASPNSTPVTYSVGGRQYVAVVSGGGSSHQAHSDEMTPEHASYAAGTTILVFGL